MYKYVIETESLYKKIGDSWEFVEKSPYYVVSKFVYDLEIIETLDELADEP